MSKDGVSNVIVLILLQMELDIAELKSLLSTNLQRESTKRLLNNELARLEGLKKRFSQSTGKEVKPAPQAYKILSNYAWDQTDKFVKIYLGLADLKGCASTCDESMVNLSFPDENSVQVICCGTKFTLTKLYEKIVPSESNFRLTKSNVVINLKKGKEMRWPNIQQTSTKPAPSEKDDTLDDNADPSTALMKLMKKMYDEGDDEMKRTISKSWYEAQHKKSEFDMAPQ